MKQLSKSLDDRQNRLRERLVGIVGDKGLVTDPSLLEPHLREPRGLFQGHATLLVRPASTAEVAAVVAACAELDVPIVPQGGNTGLVGGSIPFSTGEEIILSLSRMNRIRELDAANFTITVEAGCVLAQIQQAAEAADRLFPLSLGAEGSCQIGGNISTNAGGVQVLHYGNMRDLVLGLEVVLPDGRVWDGLRRLRKDNTGYDVKQWFIGAEGTLGVITGAVLKLFARPREIVTALAGVPDPRSAVELLGRLRTSTGECVTSFELMPRFGMEITCRHVVGCNDPLSEPQAWYVLIELFGGKEDGGLRHTLEDSLMAAHEAGLVQDAVIAESEAQRQSFWGLREGLVEAQSLEGGSIKHDVSVPVSAVPEFITRASALVERLVPGARPVPFGHVGDGNIHFNVTQPARSDRAAFMARWDEVNAAVHDLVVELRGSISAEHGIGRLKIEENRRHKPAIELELMERLKQALDPQGLMNPGKVFASKAPGRLR